MTEKELRKKVATWGDQYLGIKEGSAQHKAILKVFNDSKLCKRYTMTVNYAWCQTFASAAGIACGLADIIPVECSCENAIKLWKNLGRWRENENYTPAQGDYIYYDWQDNGVGDNTGWSDHVGIVYSVSGSKITVIEGNYSNTVKKRTLEVNGKYIRGFGLPDYASKATKAQDPTPTTVKRSKSTGVEESVIWNYLLGKIGNAFGVAGLMGNLYAESGLKPINVQNSYEKKLGYTDDTYTDAVDNGSYKNFVKDAAGYGLAQWTYYTRKQALLDYAKSIQSSIGNLTTQLEFLYTELTGYKTVLSTLKSAKSVKEASDIVLTQFERPADQSDAVKNKRAGYGQTYYDKYVGSGSKPQAPTPQAPASGSKVEDAMYQDKSAKGGKSFRTTANLNIRLGAGTNKKILKVLNKGTKATWYGYYNVVSGVKWYLVVADGVTGYVSSKYLA